MDFLQGYQTGPWAFHWETPACSFRSSRSVSSPETLFQIHMAISSVGVGLSSVVTYQREPP